MHTVELLNEALGAAQSLGYALRHEWLDGSGGGSCEVRGRKLLFIDLALDARDQLVQVVEALRSDPAIGNCRLSPRLQKMIEPRRAA